MQYECYGHIWRKNKNDLSLSTQEEEELFRLLGKLLVSCQEPISQLESDIGWGEPTEDRNLADVHNRLDVLTNDTWSEMRRVHYPDHLFPVELVTQLKEFVASTTGHQLPCSGYLLRLESHHERAALLSKVTV